MSKHGSILNLTSSTLFGIYTPSASGCDTNREESSTPWGNGSQTPARTTFYNVKLPQIANTRGVQAEKTQSVLQHPRSLAMLKTSSERVVLLFIVGVAYGVIISHLHDSQQVAPVQIETVEHGSWGYLMGWGGVGVLLGQLLPWLDVLWEDVLGIDKFIFASKDDVDDPRPGSSGGDEEETSESKSGRGLGADWNPVVRSVGAFVGIAFAIVCSFYKVIRVIR